MPSYNNAPIDVDTVHAEGLQFLARHLFNTPNLAVPNVDAIPKALRQSLYTLTEAYAKKQKLVEGAPLTEKIRADGIISAAKSELLPQITQAAGALNITLPSLKMALADTYLLHLSQEVGTEIGIAA